MVEIAPVVILPLALGDLREQRLLVAAALGVAGELVAQLALTQLQRLQLLRQRLLLLRQRFQVGVLFIRLRRALLSVLLQRLLGLRQ